MIDGDAMGLREGRPGVTISMEDFAIAILDEAEAPHFLRKRFTVGY